MKALTLGCIGCGSMGSAMLRALADCKELSLFAYDKHAEKLEALRPCGVESVSSPAVLAEQTDIILLAVKPAAVPAVLNEIAPQLTQSKTLVSIAAGLTLERLQSASQRKCPVVRVMPNTPAMVGRGVYGVCLDDSTVPQETAEFLCALFARMGKVFCLPEEKFDALTAVTGSGPAYVFYMMEAMVESAVTLGFSRADATGMVKELFSGSALLAEQSPMHLSLLREMVTSPAGTTIAALNVLDRGAVRAHIVDAVIAACDKSTAMRKA